MEHDIVERVFRLSDRTVNSLMTHRSEMVCLDVEDPIEENINKIISSGHSNFVVCKGDVDDIIGILRAKDLLREYAAGRSVAIPASLQMPPFVPEGMNALEVVERLRLNKSPVALIVDEYGSIEGMLTLTDVLEAIVGDIPALDVDGEPEAIQREDGSWLLDGLISVGDTFEWQNLRFEVVDMDGHRVDKALVMQFKPPTP
jgi:putative hemolysin